MDYVSDGEMQVLDCDNQYTIPIKRSPFSLKNIIAYRELKKILLTNDYDIIHCHTPMGGVLGRLAAKNGRVKAKIIYTAHGFHFYKGAPFINWMLYYPIEKYLSKFTDVLVTINEEDYCIAKKKFNKCRDIYKVDGVGVDLEKFVPYSIDIKNRIRTEFGFKNKDFVLLYIAEFTKRKNHFLLIKNLKKLKESIKELKVLFAGNGPLLKKYIKKIESLGLKGDVIF
ncbi:hypothetical protein FACS1894137_16480 [Spirochaetia bacterium]|nr:hypothetical protein FACS1894137_16480 [Spirochaetia bacterium]